MFGLQYTLFNLPGAQSMALVIEGKFLQNWSKEKQKNYFELPKRSRYRGYEFPKVKVQ